MTRSLSPERQETEIISLVAPLIRVCGVIYYYLHYPQVTYVNAGFSWLKCTEVNRTRKKKSVPPTKVGAKIIVKLSDQSLSGCCCRLWVTRKYWKGCFWYKKIVKRNGSLQYWESAISNVHSLKKTQCWKIREILNVNFTKHFIADQ